MRTIFTSQDPPPKIAKVSIGTSRIQQLLSVRDQQSDSDEGPVLLAAVSFLLLFRVFIIIQNFY